MDGVRGIMSIENLYLTYHHYKSLAKTKCWHLVGSFIFGVIIGCAAMVAL